MRLLDRPRSRSSVALEPSQAAVADWRSALGEDNDCPQGRQACAVSAPLSRRPAHFTQADIARAIRAMNQTGSPFVAIEIMPDGVVRLIPASEPQKAQGGKVAATKEIVL